MVRCEVTSTKPAFALYHMRFPLYLKTHTLSHLMNKPPVHTIPLNEIIVGDRLRAELGDIDILADSIRENGLIQPLVVRYSDKRLIAGGRRYTAITKLGWVEVPVYYREDISDAKLRLLELEENVRRKSMTWQEECLAVAEAHELYKREANKDGAKWGYIQTGDMLGVSSGNINYCLEIAKYVKLGDVAVLESSNLRDALRVIMKFKEDEAKKLLVEKCLPVAVPTYHPNLPIESDEPDDEEPIAELTELEELIDLRPPELRDLEQQRASSENKPCLRKNGHIHKTLHVCYVPRSPYRP